MECREVSIPVRWGQLSVKTWGNESNEAVILLHGFHCNANAFDSLIPYLPTNFYYICPDLPGHGLSTAFSDFLPQDYINYLIVISIVMNHFKQDSYTLIGHCLGASLSTHFTQLYPEKVNKLFLIEHFYTHPFKAIERLEMVKNSCDQCVNIHLNKTKNKKTYSYEEAINLLMSKEYFGSFDRKCAIELSGRMLKKIGDDKYLITNDVNLKRLMIFCASSEYLVEMMKAKPIKQEIVFVKSTKAVEQEPIQEFLKILNHVKTIEVEGDHYVHQKKPHVVGPLIKTFLLDKNKL